MKGISYSKVTGQVFTCSFKNFKGDNWDGALLKVLSGNATYSWCKKLELRQGGRDDNGFYPNYLYCLVSDETLERIDFGDYLTELGFEYSNYQVEYVEVYFDEDDIEDCVFGW